MFLPHTHTKTEHSVLEVVSHPFILNLHYAFQTSKNILILVVGSSSHLGYKLADVANGHVACSRFHLSFCFLFVLVALEL